MIRKLLFTLILPIFLLISCSKGNITSTETPTDSGNKTENTLSISPNKTTPLTFKDKNISSTNFLHIGSLIFFPNGEDNNYISVTTDNISTPSISDANIIDAFNYPIESIATISNEIFFTNISDNNSLYKLNYDKKAISKLSNTTFYNISASNKYIFFINKNENSKLSLYDIETNTSRALTLDKCGKYVVNGEFILYENLNDNSSLYSIKLDGTQRIKLTNEPIDSFIPYNNNNILYISSRDNNLYTFNTFSRESTRLHLLNGTNLKAYENRIYYIDISNSNHLHSIEVDEALTKAWTKELSTDMVNDYFPISNGIFYKKPIDINKSFFMPYK